MSLKRVLTRLGLMLLGVIAFVVVLGVVQTPMHRAGVPDAVAGIVLTPLCLALYVLWVRFAERRRADELAPAAAIPETAAGTAGGLLLMCLTIGVLALLRAYSVGGFGDWAGLAPAALIGFAVAVSEEIIFRGFLFRTVRELGGTWLAVAVSAVVFGSLHAFNPGASVTSSVAIALEAGVLLALAYAATNRLWLPIGIHFGWNFAEGPIFGTQNLGRRDRARPAARRAARCAAADRRRVRPRSVAHRGRRLHGRVDGARRYRRAARARRLVAEPSRSKTMSGDVSLLPITNADERLISARRAAGQRVAGDGNADGVCGHASANAGSPSCQKRNVSRSVVSD